MTAINEGTHAYPNINGSAATKDAAAPPAGANVVYVNQYVRDPYIRTTIIYTHK